MTDRICCIPGCDKPAQWEIWWDDSPDESTDACTEHVGASLVDSEEHRIYPIKPNELEAPKTALERLQKALDRGDYDEEAEKCFKRIEKAREGITRKHGTEKPVEDIVDSLPCPVCKKGVLQYTIASVNGHVHGQCTTKNCVSWME
jgi:hypothetical protein